MSSNQIKVKQSKPNYQNLVLVGQYWSQVQNQCELKSNQRINSNDQANGLRGSTQKNQFKGSKDHRIKGSSIRGTKDKFIGQIKGSNNQFKGSKGQKIKESIRGFKRIKSFNFNESNK